VQDTTPPALADHPDVTLEATSAAGADAAFALPAATDAADPSPAVNCDPAPGTPLPFGSSTVSCTATDASSNASAPKTFTVTVVDTTPPAFAAAPDLTAEATGPAGAAVAYPVPAAVDVVDGPEVPACLPASGSPFPFGTTLVTCSAADSRGNTGSVSFAVTVVDTLPPVLTLPGDLVLAAGTPTGTPASDPVIKSFLTGATARDQVSGDVAVTSDAPDFFAVGTTPVTFTARDAAGNVATGRATVTVAPYGAPPPPSGPPVDRVPPDDVRNLVAKAGPARVTLTWSAPAADDFDHVDVERELAVAVRRPAAARTAATVVYSGRATSFVDRGVTPGTVYRYTVIAYDHAGNRSAGAAVTATPTAAALLAPADGARVSAKRPVTLVWRTVAGASYYNVQVFRGGQKVLSTWPKRARVRLPRAWRYGNHRYRLIPGTYRWYVWPGFGARSAAKYGPLLGEQTFVVG
jgi:hypothetical protein